MRHTLLPLLLFVFAATGCIPPSMNYQRSGLRSAGDVGATALLEQADAKMMEKYKVDIVDTCNAVIKYLDGGKVADLTPYAVEAKLREIVPIKYIPLLNTALTAIDNSNATVNPSTAIGPDNVKRIKAAVIGFRQGTIEYDVNDRLKEVPPSTAPVAGAGPAAGGTP
jgi:hypothetical protein